jgi:hypothetical protein
MLWKKTTPNDGSGFCPNLTFEDEEFKEDNKALNDQGESERELMLFCLLQKSLEKPLVTIRHYGTKSPKCVPKIP